jgi:hypothetical protein
MNKKAAFFAVLAVALAAAAFAAIPSFIPIYPGSEVVAQKEEEGYGMAHLLVSNKKTPSEIGDWYEVELKKKGWDDIEKVDEGDDYCEIHASYYKKNLWLNVMFSYSEDEDNTVEINIEWGPEEDD